MAKAMVMVASIVMVVAIVLVMAVVVGMVMVVLMVVVILMAMALVMAMETAVAIVMFMAIKVVIEEILVVDYCNGDENVKYNGGIVVMMIIVVFLKAMSRLTVTGGANAIADKRASRLEAVVLHTSHAMETCTNQSVS